MSYTLEQTREIDGALLLDDSGRYYALHSDGYRVYGYSTAWGCGYVCYTCGHLCECGEDSDYVDTVSWSSSNPTGEVR